MMDATTRRTRDAVLLLHGMMCIAGADGSFAEAEVRMVEAYFAQLPELRGEDFDALVAAAREVVEGYGSAIESLEALAGLSTPALKRKLFVVAVDIALASGQIDAREGAMLTALQVVLGIDDGLRDRVLEVLSLKYAV